jgi:hypothetical protein
LSASAKGTGRRKTLLRFIYVRTSKRIATEMGPNIVATRIVNALKGMSAPCVRHVITSKVIGQLRMLQKVAINKIMNRLL